jgi:hypothetical protein
MQALWSKWFTRELLAYPWWPVHGVPVAARRGSIWGTTSKKQHGQETRTDGTRRKRVRLSALVILQISLPCHLEFAVQYHFFHTRHPLYPVLHTNNLIFSLYFTDSFELPSSLTLD